MELHLSMKNVIIVKEALFQDGIHSLSVFSVATTFFTKDVLRNMASSALSASTSMKRYVSYNFWVLYCFIESIINQRGVRRIVGKKNANDAPESDSEGSSPVYPQIPVKKSQEVEKEVKRTFMEEFQMQMTIYEKE